MKQKLAKKLNENDNFASNIFHRQSIFIAFDCCQCWDIHFLRFFCCSYLFDVLKTFFIVYVLLVSATYMTFAEPIEKVQQKKR